MEINIITLFPEFFSSPLSCSLIARAMAVDAINLRFFNPRDFTRDKHRKVDSPPFGGGPGMTMMPSPLFAAVEAAGHTSVSRPRVILTTPQGRTFSQREAVRLSRLTALTIVCGHYGGVDERFAQYGADEELSIGDYILTGGETAALAITEAVARLLPGVIGNPVSPETDSFSETNQGLLQAPQYTRPVTYKGKTVPKVLLSGDHSKVAEWRTAQSVERTRKRRPDLLKKRRAP